MTELHRAAHYGDEALVRQLLQRPGIAVDALDEDRCTSLMLAARSAATGVLDQLLAAGAAVDGPDDAKWPPLLEAARAGHPQIVARLLAAGAAPDSARFGRSALAFACQARDHRRSTAVIQTIIAAGADVNRCVEVAPVHEAVLSDNAAALEALAAAGADLDARRPFDDATTLTLAAWLGRRRCLETLLAAGADPRAADHQGRTALHCLSSVHTGTASAVIVRSLLEAGCDPVARDAGGRTPLAIAAADLEQNPWAFHSSIAPAMVLLVAAGAREWDYVPAPCPGLERALLAVWRAAPEDLGRLFQRLEPQTQELVCQCLFAVHGRLPEELRMRVVEAALVGGGGDGGEG